MERHVLGRKYNVHFRDHRNPVRGSDSSHFSATTRVITNSSQSKAGNRRAREVRVTSDPRSDQSAKSSDALQSDVGAAVHNPEVGQRRPLMNALERSTVLLPYAVVAAAALALVRPASYSWFTPPMYAPALGFLMFAVGVNLNASAFAQVFQRPQYLLVGSLGQWIVKPLLGLMTASVVPLLGLPAAVGNGIVLVSCVSGAQLSNYATFLVHPDQAPLSIVLTALSTLMGAAVTPALVLLLLGRKVPVDAVQMAISIFQVVVAPVTGGLLCNRFVPQLVRLAKPFVVFASLLDTCACVGASLSSNAEAARSLMGLRVLVPVVLFHSAAFVSGYIIARQTIAKHSIPLARCISLETGMQSSLLGLLLATRFFNDSFISLACGISVIVMTLSGFGLVVFWKSGRQQTATV